MRRLFLNLHRIYKKSEPDEGWCAGLPQTSFYMFSWLEVPLEVTFLLESLIFKPVFNILLEVIPERRRSPDAFKSIPGLIYPCVEFQMEAFPEKRPGSWKVTLHWEGKPNKKWPSLWDLVLHIGLQTWASPILFHQPHCQKVWWSLWKGCEWRLAKTFPGLRVPLIWGWLPVLVRVLLLWRAPWPS